MTYDLNYCVTCEKSPCVCEKQSVNNSARTTCSTADSSSGPLPENSPRVKAAALTAIDKMRKTDNEKMVELGRLARSYFVSGNDVPVTRVVLKRSSVEHLL